MPPAPARIASTPRQNSKTSWNPAVPPPPVPGAAVGNELADGLGEGDRLGLGVTVPPGENEGSVVDGVPAVQADTNAGASMANAAQPRTVPRKRRRPYR